MIDGEKCILLVEDENRLRRVLKDFFVIKGYSVLEAADGQEALEVFYDHNTDIDIVLLDWMLPVRDGIEVLKEIRKISETPVIMLTAKGTEQDQMKGFERGADDYLVKPFSNQIVLAHIEAVLKRSKSIVGSHMKVGVLEIDRESKTVKYKGVSVSLTMKEYEMLIYLVDHKGMNLSRESILDSVWGLSYEGDSRTVDTHIKQLRGKLPEHCNYIKTVYGLGYRFDETGDENE